MTPQTKFTKLSALVATALLVVSTLQFASPIHAAPTPAALSPRSPQSGLPNADDIVRDVNNSLRNLPNADDIARSVNNGLRNLPNADDIARDVNDTLRNSPTTGNGVVGLPNRSVVVIGDTTFVIEDDGTVTKLDAEAEADKKEEVQGDE